MVYFVGHAAVFCAVWFSLRFIFEVQLGIVNDIFGPRGITTIWSIYIILISIPAAIIAEKYLDWLGANISWDIEKQQICYDPGQEKLKARTSVYFGGYLTIEDEIRLDREKATNAN